ncbi:hypothetical protein E2562_001592 [Oryza meyeriana var. granulata]|uniref:Uncharacterized protein n=1 Tax=Oryza meyeriana var. granulata TaxID=110450 RepID=A0A6G1CCK4_9ORYZ|nr:hypothetical protein E2562_001592 [Oryza meyeriana var. granulata]
MREDDHFGATVAQDFTSTGDRIIVAFKPSAPPGISRLLFDCHPNQQQEEEADNKDSFHFIYDEDDDTEDLPWYQDNKSWRPTATQSSSA